MEEEIKIFDLRYIKGTSNIIINEIIEPLAMDEPNMLFIMKLYCDVKDK